MQRYGFGNNDDVLSGKDTSPPQGSPDWVTSDLIAQTIETWAPYYNDNLTPDDALEILMAVDRLFAVLEDMDDG